jgi:hypothetical protein
VPWIAWWQTATTGDLWPLGLAVYCQAAYYLIGIARLLAGYGPWGCEPPEPDVQYPEFE